MISEAAKKAARQIFEVATITPMYGLSPADEVNAALEIQSAIDAETARITAEKLRLYEALMQYGVHSPLCALTIGQPCNCGLFEVLTKAGAK